MSNISSHTNRNTTISVIPPPDTWTPDTTPDTTSMGVFFVIFSSMVMVSNLVVIIVVVKSKSLHLPTLWNIAFMALCDFGYGAFYMIFAAPSALVNGFFYHPRGVTPGACFLTFFFGQNVFNILVATIDRYLSMCWPYQYPRLMTAKRFVLANVITFSLNVTRLCIIAIPEETFYNPVICIVMFRFRRVSSAAASTGLPFITVLLVIVLLIRLFVEMRRSKRRIRPSPADRSVQSFTFTIFLSVLVFCLNYAPVGICILWLLATGFDSVPAILQQIGVVSLMSNSLWNVLIYGVFYKPFREEFLRLFCTDYYRRKRQREMQVVAQAPPKMEISTIPVP